MFQRERLVFYQFPCGVFKRWSVCAGDTYVYRRVPRLYGRRDKNKHIFCGAMFSQKLYCESAFKRKISDDIVLKSFVLCFLSLLLVCAGTGLIIGLEPQYSFMQVLFEAVSAFGTVGLSTGITPYLGASAKLILILLMFVGRVGILTVASAWIYQPPAKAAYSQEYISIG